MHEFRLRNLLIVLAGLVTILAADHLGLFVGLNSYCYSLAFRLRGPEKPSPNLVIAAIDEKTLGTLGRWPLARSRYAQLLDALHEARAVGFTIIMTETSVDDVLLARTAAASGRTVFPCYIDTRHRLQLPAGELAGIPAGHIHVEQDIGGKAIAVSSSLHLGQESTPLPAFASLVTSLATVSPPGVVSTSARPNAPSATQEITQSSPMRINYCGPPGTIPAVSFADIVAGKYSPGEFRDKIVIVGITAAGLGDGLLTPFSQNRDRMSSVEVQANIVNSFLNHNSIRFPGDGARLLIFGIVSSALFLVFTLLAETSATTVWFLTLAGFTIAEAILFSQSRIWLDPALFFTSATFLYVMAIMLKLDKAATKLQEECSAIAFHLNPDARQQEKKRTLSGLIGHLSLTGINGKAGILGEATRQLLQRSKEVEGANRELEKKHRQVSELKGALEERVAELEAAVARVRQLEEMIPICMYCKKIRDDKDYWDRLESYFEKHAGLMFTHSICPECYQEQLLDIEETERLEESLRGQDAVPQ
jgi:CHASE2 domain-containing sensor protein